MMEIRAPETSIKARNLRDLKFDEPKMEIHVGKEVTNKMAIKQQMGESAQMNATWRHGSIDPKTMTEKWPKLNEIDVNVINIPRTDGSLETYKKWIDSTAIRSELNGSEPSKYLISLMYVSEGASFRPKQNPSSVNITEIKRNDWLNPKILQSRTRGILMSIRALRRPILSLIGPLIKLPIGWAMDAKLAGKMLNC